MTKHTVSLPGRVYCYTCERFKYSFNRCNKYHHDLEYDMGVNDKELDDALLKLCGMDWFTYITTSRRVAKTSTELASYSPIVTDETTIRDTCPIHDKKPFGYCFTCKRSICFTNNPHFGHKVKLYAVSNIPTRCKHDPENEDACIMEYEQLIDFRDKFDEISVKNKDIYHNCIDAIANSILKHPSDTLRSLLIELMNTFITKFDDMLEADANKLDQDIDSHLKKLSLYSTPDALKPVVRNKYKPTTLQTFCEFVQHKSKFVRMMTIDKRYDVLVNTYGTVWVYSIECKKYRRMDYGHLIGVPYVKNNNVYWYKYVSSRKTTFKSTFNATWNDFLIYDNDIYTMIDNKSILHLHRLKRSIEADQITEEAIEVPFEIKSLIQTTNINIKLMANSADGRIMYMDENNEWKEIGPTLAKFCVDAYLCVGSWLRPNELEYSMFVSCNSVYVYNRPTKKRHNSYYWPVGRFELVMYKKYRMSHKFMVF